MRLRNMFSRLAALALLNLTATYAFGQVTVSNLGETLLVAEEIAPNRWLAGSFTTDAYSSSYQLASVTVNLYDVSGTPTGFSLRLFSDNSGAPGTSLETLSGNNNPTTTGNYSYTSSGTTLNSNSTYWIVASAATGAYDPGSDFYYWGASDTNNQTTTGGPTWLIGDVVSYSTNSGSSWVTSSSTYDLKFSVSTAAAIPEPSTCAALFGACALGLVGYRRHRLKKAA